MFRSLHSRQQDYTSFAPGTRDAVPARPRTLGDLVEGQTLAFQVSVEGGPSVLLTGTSNVAERELAGARPDVAVIGMSGYAAVHGYPDRLLAALGSPSLILPCHHDDMVTPLGSSGISGTASSDAVAALTRAVERQGWAGGTRVLAPGTWSCSTSPGRPPDRLPRHPARSPGPTGSHARSALMAGRACRPSLLGASDGGPRPLDARVFAITGLVH